MSDTDAPLVSPGRLRPATNAATPIANIPDDVLLDIFRIVVEQSDYMTRKLLRKGKTWLAVTHVCTYWRNSILDTAELWTRLRFWSFFNQKLARAFLQRAGNRLVSLEYRGSGPRPIANPMTIASFIDSNSSHLGALSIVELDETETAVFCGKLRTPAMKLQRLEIQSHVGQHTVVYPIFTNTLPALRVFRITGLWITLPHAANLRELVLLECRSVPFEALLKYLQEMPLLEVLHIDKARDSRREWPPVFTLPLKPPLLMPHLRSLTLSFTHPEDLFVALRLIAFPPAAAVHLHFREMQTLTITALPDVPPSLEAITSSISDASLTISQVPMWAVVLRAIDRDLQLQWSCEAAEQGADNLVFMLQRTTFNALPFPSLRRLAVRSTPALRSDAWRVLFGPLSGLETLEVDVHQTSLWTLGSEMCTFVSDDPIPLPFCPQLKHLHVMRLQDEGENLCKFLTMLVNRARKGLQLESLTLELMAGQVLPPESHSLLSCVQASSTHVWARSYYYAE